MSSIVFVFLIGCSSLNTREVSYKGTPLVNHKGYEFSMTDHSGRNITPSSPRGGVKILTFLFTSCTNVCPIITSNIKNAVLQVNKPDLIQVIIITVDPDRDTADAVDEYIQKWKLPSNWQFLTGTKKELSPIWKAYFINPQTSLLNSGAGPESVKSAFDDRYSVIHTAPVYILNSGGIPKTVHTNQINESDLAHDIREVLRGSN